MKHQLPGFFYFLFMGFYYAFIWKGKWRVDRKALGEERGERDRQRTTSRDSNSGRREHSCAVCQCTNREAIGADLPGIFKKQCKNIYSTNMENGD